MKLLQLSLSNFKGIDKLTLKPNGGSIDIYGANASGKTTIVDAITWLLIDKDSQDKSPAAFGIKTLDENGNVIHCNEHTVEGEFMTGTDNIFTLRKVYKEKWTSKRGSSETNLTGHSTDYYWDEEPVSAGEYKDRMEAIMPERMFKMLTLPNYFPELLHWTERRDILTELAGDIETDDVINRNPGLNGYKELLDGKSEDAQKKILKQRKKKLKEELDNIPSRIDEAQGFIQEVEGVNDAEKSIEALKETKVKYQEELGQAKAGGGVAELNVKVQEIEAEKSKAHNEHQKQVDESLSDARKKVSDLESRVDESEAELREATREYQEVKRDIEDAEEAAEKISEDLEAAQDMTPDPKPEPNDGSDVCPYCEQEMPKKDDEGDHEQHYQKYLKDFNAKKAAKIKELKADFEQGQIVVDDLYKQLKQKEQAGAKARAKDSQRKSALEKTKQELEQRKQNAPEFDAEPFDQRQQVILDKISAIKSSRKEQIEEIEGRIREVEQQIEKHQQVIHQAQTNQRYRDRIKELREMQKKYGSELNDVEAGLRMIEQFGRTKAELITEKVNGLFDIVNWKLFKDQLNEGVTEICEATVNGVPYSEGLNNAARIAAGIDIIETLSRHYEKSAPVCVDNAEAITDIPETDLQVIALYVSGEDRKLRVEQQERQLAAV